MSTDNEELIADGDSSVRSRSLIVPEFRVSVLTTLDEMSHVGEVPSAETPLQAKADWPQLILSKSGWWWAGAYGVALTAVAFFYAVFTAQHHPWRALIAVLVLPFFAVTGDYIVRCAVTIYRRFAQYESLLEVIRKDRYELEESRQQLSLSESLVSELLVAFARIEIQLVQVFRGDVFVRLKPKRNMKLQIGNRVRVIDVRDGKAMGTFEVTEVAPAYLGKALGDLNPLWSGYLREAGTESTAPPHLAAFLLERE
jgi:hypothetical protein